MNVVNFNGRSCDKYRRYFDAYLDNELLVETNQDVLQHLASCPDCAAILESRARMKRLVKNAVLKEAVPPELAAALRDRFDADRRSFFGSDAARWTMAAAAVLILAIGGAGALQWGRVLPFSGDSGMLQTVSTRVQDILRIGLVDHFHCAISSARWKKTVSFDDMKAQADDEALGPQFIDLVPEVQAKLGPGFKIVQGHRCIANERHYVHVILTGEKNTILSLVITEKQGESFRQPDAIAAMQVSGIPVYRDRQGIYEIAGFESGKYVAYVVSNMDRQSNLNVVSVVAPIVRSHLQRLEI